MSGDGTSGNIRGDAERLETYTEEMELTIPVPRTAIEEYEKAVQAFNATPNDLGTTLEDLGPSLHAELDALRELDRAPAAFAFALRNLDQLTAGDGRWTWMLTSDLEWFNALTQARLNMPDATDAEVIAAAQTLLDTSWDWPWEKKGLGGWAGERLASPFWWTDTAIEGATATVVEVDKHLITRVSGYYGRTGRRVDPYVRWHRGTADFMNRISAARIWAKIAPWTRRVGFVAAPLVPATEQLVKDWDDPTSGDRIVRTGAAAILDGGGSLGGAAAGAKIGATAGAAIGSVFPGPQWVPLSAGS